MLPDADDIGVKLNYVVGVIGQGSDIDTSYDQVLSKVIGTKSAQARL